MIAIAIHGLHITGQGEITRTIAGSLIESVVQGYLLVTDIDIRHLGGIHSSHHDTGREAVAPDNRLGVWNDESRKGIHADILHVDTLYQCMQHLTLCITDIALQLR